MKEKDSEMRKNKKRSKRKKLPGKMLRICSNRFGRFFWLTQHKLHKLLSHSPCRWNFASDQNEEDRPGPVMVSNTLCPAVHVFGTWHLHNNAKGISDHYWPRPDLFLYLSRSWAAEQKEMMFNKTRKRIGMSMMEGGGWVGPEGWG